MAPVDDSLSAARERVVALRASLEGTEDQPVRLVEAPISWVLLAGSLAYKLKKPVQWPLLDFTTLVSRRRFPDGALWSEMLGGGRPAASPIDAMSIRLADFHRDAAVATPANRFGSTESHARVTPGLMGAIDATRGRRLGPVRG